MSKNFILFEPDTLTREEVLKAREEDTKQDQSTIVQEVKALKGYSLA